MTETKPGERFRCADCGTEVMVIKSGGPVPHCCGRPVTAIGKPGAGLTSS
jgi:Desulfoferrodoxin, N-terminal domain